jgi:hypothetical protein
MSFHLLKTYIRSSISPLMSALTIHTFGNQRKGKRKETNKKKLQQVIENRERQRKRSLEEDKSQTP